MARFAFLCCRRRETSCRSDMNLANAQKATTDKQEQHTGNGTQLAMHRTPLTRLFSDSDSNSDSDSDSDSDSVSVSVSVYRLTMQRLALDPGINLLTSLCSSTFATPIFLDPAVLCAVSKHNKEGMIANIINLSVPRNDARDHAPGRQGVRDDSRSFKAF